MAFSLGSHVPPHRFLVARYLFVFILAFRSMLLPLHLLLLNNGKQMQYVSNSIVFCLVLATAIDCLILTTRIRIIIFESFSRTMMLQQLQLPPQLPALLYLVMLAATHFLVKTRKRNRDNSTVPYGAMDAEQPPKKSLKNLKIEFKKNIFTHRFRVKCDFSSKGTFCQFKRI